MTQRQLLQVLEEYLKGRMHFVQTMSELASRPQNMKMLKNANVTALLQPLLLDADPSVQHIATQALGRLVGHSEDMAKELVQGKVLPQIVHSLPRQNNYYKKAATLVLRSVAKHSATLAKAVLDCGTLDSIMICLDEFDPGVKESAIWVLCHVARHNEGKHGKTSHLFNVDPN
uniref:sperm-associated antigen 6-like n=1 Tax=Myxine glutinosa TaxID=7769 RepID=UPI00358EB31A